VEIADTPADFVSAVEACLRPDSERQARADAFLGKMSWDETFGRMKRLLDQSAQRKQKARSAHGRAAEAK
jgi:hypothetical protein